MKKIIKYMNPKNLAKEIRLYGYSYSLNKQLMLMFVIILGIVVLAKIIGLTLVQLVILIIGISVGIPQLFVNIFRNMYEQKRFVDVSNYVEQMLYSFKRKSKILTALEETAILFPEGLIGDTMQKMINHINHSSSEGNVYEEAFAMMEQEYNCDIVQRVHSFMKRVEMNGGKYEASIEILILDRNKWVSRTLEAQKEKRMIKRNVAIGIFLSLMVSIGTIFMIPVELVDIKSNTISQISSLIIFLLNFWLWVFVQSKMSGSWIVNNNGFTEKQIEKDYEIVINSDRKKGKYLSKKRLRREVEKTFPDWMLELTLLLQTDNVQVAIYNSVENSPIALRKELQLLEEKIEKNPTSINPYLEFYECLNINEIQSAMRMLYSLSQNGSEDMTKQIQALVERNVELQDQSERLKTEDYLAGMGFCVLVPMVFSCGKMLIDMGLLMYGILSAAQTFY